MLDDERKPYETARPSEVIPKPIKENELKVLLHLPRADTRLLLDAAESDDGADVHNLE
jgi:hypothetical protein